MTERGAAPYGAAREPGPASPWNWPARLLVVSLLAVTIVRIALFLSHEPLLALANNYDMIRVQGCIDAYPVRDRSIDPAAGNYLAPIERYAFRSDIDAGCYFTSERIIAAASLPLMRAAAARSADGSFSIRIVAAVKLCAFAVLLGFGAWGFWRNSGPTAAIVLCAVAAAVLCDPAILVNAPGFYAEYAAFLFLAGAIIALSIALDSRGTARVACLVGAFCVLGLATSKVQHLALGLVVAALVGAALLVTRRRRVTPFLCALVAGALGFGLQIAHYRGERTVSMQRANLTNTVLATLFVVSDDPHTTAERLGLPRACADHAGKNWYLPGKSENPPCPEVFELTRLDLLRLVLTEPTTLIRTYWGGLTRLRPWIPDGLGVVEGEQLGRLPPGIFSWARVLERMAAWQVLMLVIAPLLLVPGALATGSIRRAGAAFAWAALAVVPFAVVGAVVFGDGYIDVPRQGTLAFACVLSFWVALATRFVVGIPRGFIGLLHERAWRRADADRAVDGAPHRGDAL